MATFRSKIGTLLRRTQPCAADAAFAGLEDIRREITSSGALRAAININNPLLAKRDPQSGTLSGVAVDLTRELARRLGSVFELIPFEAAARITGSAQDDVWDVAYLAVDPLREKDIHFTAPYLELEGSYMVWADSAVQSREDLDRDGVRIAVTAGSAYDLFLTRALQRAQLVRVASTPESLQLMHAQKLDAVAAVRTVLAAEARTVPGLRVLPGHFMTIPQAVGVPRGRRAAARYVSGLIEELKATGFVARVLAGHGHGPDDASVAPAASPAGAGGRP